MATPEPPWPVPAGLIKYFEWGVHPDWRLVPSNAPPHGRTCRRIVSSAEHPTGFRGACSRPAVGQMRRVAYYRSGKRDQWWGYCAAHAADYMCLRVGDQFWGWRHKPKEEQ